MHTYDRHDDITQLKQPEATIIFFLRQHIFLYEVGGGVINIIEVFFNVQIIFLLSK